MTRGALIFSAAIFALACAAPLTAQTADPRAVTACQSIDPGFVNVEQCLPEMNVAILMLDELARPDSYGERGAELALRCTDLNRKDPRAAWACAENAVQAAVRLAKMLPAGATLEDPLYSALTDPKTLDLTEARERALKQQFPDVTFWGMTTYYPLK